MTMTRRLSFIAALVLAGLGGCSRFPAPGNPQKCGDPCATLNCPDGMRCQVSGNCAPSCEVLRSYP